MDAKLLEWAATNARDNAIALGVLLYLIVSGPGVFLYRRHVQGRNGNASLRGQLDHIEAELGEVRREGKVMGRTLDRMEETTQKSHDLLIEHEVRIEGHDREIERLRDAVETGRD